MASAEHIRRTRLNQRLHIVKMIVFSGNDRLGTKKRCKLRPKYRLRQHPFTYRSVPSIFHFCGSRRTAMLHPPCSCRFISKAQTPVFSLLKPHFHDFSISEVKNQPAVLIHIKNTQNLIDKLLDTWHFRIHILDVHRHISPADHTDIGFFPTG